MNRNALQPGLSLLVVDDNLVHRRMSQAVLASAGYTVILADGGPQALEIMQKTVPDVVLLDIRMPGMDGFEVCRRLRALPFGKSIPILFFSDPSGLEASEQILASAADDFLSKPINQIEVVMRIRSLLRIKKNKSLVQQLLETSFDAIAVLDEEGLIKKWNAQAQSLFGWTDEEALGRQLFALILSAQKHSALRDHFKQQIAASESSILNRHTALTAVHKNGQEFAIELHLTSKKSGAATAFCACIRAGSAKR